MSEFKAHAYCYSDLKVNEKYPVGSMAVFQAEKMSNFVKCSNQPARE